jgi:hypothetical protein
MMKGTSALRFYAGNVCKLADPFFVIIPQPHEEFFCAVACKTKERRVPLVGTRGSRVAAE